ncbi:MAG: polyphosphate kinase 1 [Saprospiraceae bacterium]|nr:polyphosphate kinase 1 [Saprospiraceae bacterium]
MLKNIPYIHRDISWLAFNHRVLQEAKDTANPLFERIKFLAIYSSNLDEFFRVRVAQLRHLIQIGKKTKKQLDFDPKAVLREINKIVTAHQEEFSKILHNSIVPELRTHNIFLKRRLDLTPPQRKFVEDYFNDNMLPFVQPVLLVKDKINPFLVNAALYLSLHIREKGRSSSASEYAIIKIPSDHLPRFIRLPSHKDGNIEVMMLDDIVRHCAGWLFPGYNIVDTYSIKLTRDAELYIDDEYKGDLIEKLKKSLVKRSVGTTSRFVYDRDMPPRMLEFLRETFHLEKSELLPEGRYHNNFDFFTFPDFGKMHLKTKPLPPIPFREFEEANDIFKLMKKNDTLLYYPYHSYESVIKFFEEAAKDPKVTHIKLVQYRVAKNSQIMHSLMEAAQAGKQVSVFIEVKARFDEEANIKWGEKLQAAGVNVHYSMPGVKVHSKLGLIRRKEGAKYQLYSYMSTGNFHEDTAKVYTDFGLFTADARLTEEVAKIFSYLETLQLPEGNFNHLLVGQFNLREKLLGFIDNEIQAARQNKKAHIILKMNNLEDREMIEKLYEASNAGVKIQLIIRSICCLVPGIKGYSENIEILSIVDRFLEHSRVFIFHNSGQELIYLSSADWMLRNLSFRIETAFPILNVAIKKEIKEYLHLQLKDNVKARIIDAKLENVYKKSKAHISVRSQIDTYFQIKRKEDSK